MYNNKINIWQEMITQRSQSKQKTHHKLDYSTINKSLSLLSRFKLQPTIFGVHNNAGFCVLNWRNCFPISWFDGETLHYRCDKHEHCVACKCFASTQPLAGSKRQRSIFAQTQFAILVEKSFGFKQIRLFPNSGVFVRCIQWRYDKWVLWMERKFIVETITANRLRPHLWDVISHELCVFQCSVWDTRWSQRHIPHTFPYACLGVWQTAIWKRKISRKHKIAHRSSSPTSLEYHVPCSHSLDAIVQSG